MSRICLLALVLVACAPSPAERAEKEARTGLELARSGEVGAAVERFQRALELDPTNLAARYNLGLAHLRGGQWVLAATELERFLELRPDDTEGHFELARAQLLAGYRDAALDSIARAVQLGFADHARLVEADLFGALYSNPRWLALEMTVAQRAGVEPHGGVLGLPGGDSLGRGTQTVPGLRLHQPACARRDEGGACLPP